MANIYKDMNVRQKLAKARLYFLNKKVQKSGKNMKLEFKYFELEDIVPPAIRIFASVGLVTETDINETTASMKVYNADNPDEAPLVFSVPFRENDPIISKSGAIVTNKLQTIGSSITYLRRYLWMAVLDITEPDEVDATLGETETEEPEEITPPNVEKAEKAKKETAKKSTPATAEDRKKAKIKLTGADEQADDLQIKALKAACKELMSKDESQEEFVQQIAMKTAGMTKVTRSQCEQLVNKINEMLAQYKE